MIARSLIYTVSAAVFALAQSGAALACACCTNPGYRYVESEKIQSFRRDIIRDIRFTNTAKLLVGERDLADIKGIVNPSETYSLSVSQQKDRFIFSFRDEKKQEGTLTLALSDTISIFEIDPRDPEAPGNGGTGPLLYKEWRLTAPFAGTGIFKAGNGGYQRITLIFQGRGRACPDAAQFTHWTISVYGPLGSYMFFGELQKQ